MEKPHSCQLPYHEASCALGACWTEQGWPLLRLKVEEVETEEPPSGSAFQISQNTRFQSGIQH